MSAIYLYNNTTTSLANPIRESDPNDASFVAAGDHLVLVIDTVINCILVNIISPFGVVGNALNIVILAKYDVTSDSSNILLVSLSVADFVYCLTTPIRRCKCLLAIIMDPATAVTVDTFIWEYVFVLNRAMFCISISLVGVISLERLLVVYLPFSASKLLTPSRMKTVSILMYSINFVFFVPFFFCFSHTWTYDERLNATVAVIVFTEFYQNNMQAILFESFIGHNLIFLGTCVVIVFFSSPGIAYKIWAMTKTRQKMTRKTVRFDPQLAKMLLVISSACFIFYSPSLIFDTIVYFIPSLILENQVYNLFQIFTDLLFAISSSANFIIYVTMSSKFSKAYRSLLVCSLRSKSKVTRAQLDGTKSI